MRIDSNSNKQHVYNFAMNSYQIRSPLITSKRRQIAFHPNFLKKIRHVGTISEHTGCVNRLVWSDDGKVLASCSDDLHICLWNMEWKNTQPCSIIPTSHKNNIFCVKFIPQRENKVIVTGSMDSAVEIHTLADDLRSRVSGSLFYCHKEAVKYIEVEPQSPNVFFSVGEDGCVRQYDFRIKSLGCQVDTGVTTSLRKVGCMYQSPNCLLKCKDKLRINSMKICPVNNNLFVLATSENRVSIYDRRTLSMTSPRSVNFHSSSDNPIVSFCPEHLLEKPSCYASYAEFSPCGQNVLACFHSDHSYVFPLFDVRNGGSGSGMVCSDETSAPFPWRVKSGRIKDLREKVNLAKEAVDVGLKAMDIGLNITSYNMFTRAIDISLQAVAIRDSRFRPGRVPASNALYDVELSERTTQVLVSALTHRASVCEKRGFVGDDVVGLMDLQQALDMHPRDVEVLIMKAKFLLNLHRPQEALIELERIAELRNIDSNELIYIQNDVDTLRLKANYAIMDSLRLQSKVFPSVPSSTQVDDSGLIVSSAQQIKRNHCESALPNTSEKVESKRPKHEYKQTNMPNSVSNAAHSKGTTRLVVKYSQRFVGASNIATDIKECVYVGSNGEYVAGGSDDGRFFVWDRFSGEILLCRSADPDVLSCLQPHPTLPIIATSGLDDSVRLWGPPSARHFFRRLNRNDPFKLQCGKLELPELSRMRLQRPHAASHLPPTHIDLPLQCSIPSNQNPTQKIPSLVQETRSRSTSLAFESGAKHCSNERNIISDSGDFAMFHEAGLSSNGGGSTSLTNSSQAGPEQDECGSGSTCSYANCGSSTDSSDYGLVLEDSCSDFNEICLLESSVESEKPKRKHLKVSETSRSRSCKKVDIAHNAVAMDVCLVDSVQSQQVDGDSDSRGSNRDGSSTTGDKVSDSNDEGQTGCDSAGTRSCPSTDGVDAVNSSEKTAVTTDEKSNNNSLNPFKQRNNDNHLNSTHLKDNDTNTNSLGDRSSDRTSGSVCDSSSSRSSIDNQVPGASTPMDNFSTTISSSNNNSDKNSDTDIDGGGGGGSHGLKYWSNTNTDRENSKSQQNKRSEGDCVNLSTGSKAGTNKKRSDKNSSRDKNETVTNSSDSDSAVLKLVPDGRVLSECLNNNMVSLSVYRRALQVAVEGLPMDADEALALEEIVAENQRLIKFNPSPLFYRQLSMNSNTAPSIALSSNAVNLNIDSSGVEPYSLSNLYSSSHPTTTTTSYENHNNHSTSVASTSENPVLDQSVVQYNNSCNPS